MAKLKGRTVRWAAVAGLVGAACVGAALVHRARTPNWIAFAPEAPHAGSPSTRVAAGNDDGSSHILAKFQAFVKEQGDIDYPTLVERLGAAPKKETSLSFDPTTVRYFSEVERELKLTSEERRIFRERGVVSVDHQQQYSMGSAYYAIYTRDLPVLITTDSILHALHRSFDATLKTLETTWFATAIGETLTGVAKQLEKEARNTTDPALRTSLEDVDLYVTVARNLMAGAGAPPDEPDQSAPSVGKFLRGIPVAPEIADTAAVRALLDKIGKLELEVPDHRSKCTPLYGGKRCIDYSQFRVRGHYTDSPDLRRYFRTLMWLGRADLGWNLRAVDPVTRIVTRPERERRDAAVLVFALRSSGELAKLAAVGRLIDFMVGTADNVSIDEMSAALKHASITRIDELASTSALERLEASLGAVGAREQGIRSQVLDSDPKSTTASPMPLEFQVFGQRFLLDSFVLSRVVYDSIVYAGEKQERWMPSGLDAMAALGNDEAVRLLEPELVRHKYASNLLAARRVVDDVKPEEWRATAYNQWLGALRTLDDTPSGPHFPEVMRREAWRRKQLRTALGSWAELRHDTILYGKQSYTSYASCEYPSGYVEPYPEFFARLSELTTTLADRIAAADSAHDDPEVANNRNALKLQLGGFYRRFSDVMKRLQALAELELAALPFSADDEAFLKKTIDIRGGGSGPPRYDGWYTTLIYGDPARYKPTVADVHTDPTNGSVLEEGVGNVQFLVLAVNDEAHRAVYVGPSYSYYEFQVPPSQRMTDEEWEKVLADGPVPKPPAWTGVFQAPGVARQMGGRSPEP